MWIFKIVALWIMWGMGFWAGFLRGRIAELKACNEMLKEVDEMLQETQENCDQCFHRWLLLWKSKEDAADD